MLKVSGESVCSWQKVTARCVWTDKQHDASREISAENRKRSQRALPLGRSLTVNIFRSLQNAFSVKLSSSSHSV